MPKDKKGHKNHIVHKMINQKTLHVGSHIMVNGVRARIESIGDADYIGYTTIDDSVIYIADPSMSYVEPIPLTAQVLAEIGFEEKINCGIKVFQKLSDEKSVKFIYDGPGIWRCNCYADKDSVSRVGMARRISYLHQAEQMLSVYGIELIKE